MRWEVIDQQWVATAEEADEVERKVAPRAARYGYHVSRERSGRGYLVKVEKKVDDD